jgi:radical SAM protein with 4Fe4S-binding SPASM domain
MLSPLMNASYSVFSYAARRYAGININPPLPPAISIELSSVCNLSCPECVTGAGLLARKNRFMDYDMAVSIASQLRGITLSAWLYFQGEPMMHPRFFEITALFRKMNPVISTNGHFLDLESCHRLASSGIKRIIIPYDGITPAVYNLYRRGGDHVRVTEGIRTLASVIRTQHSSMKIELQFLLHRDNEHEKAAVAAFAGSVGARFRVKSMQVLDSERAGQWMAAEKGRSRYLQSGEEWKVTGLPARGCMRMWTTPVITTDGDVLPCCFDKNGTHAMGNLNSSTIREIWDGKNYRVFRGNVIRNRGLTDICRDCIQGRRVIFRS